MKQQLPLPQSASLRMKLVLSYLAVTLGSILVMVIVVAIAVSNYFYISQINELRGETQTWAQDFAALYQSNNYNWEELNIGPIVRLPKYLVISDLQGQKYGLGTKLVGDNDPSASTDNLINQALSQALKGQESEGTIDQSYPDPVDLSRQYTFNGLYVCEPITLNNKIVGAIFVIQPNHFPGFSATDFLANVDLILLITGVGLSLLVIGFSLFMSNRLTRPLISLTRAAEEMKRGNYTHRVEEPPSMDEIGQLALTFNSMAAKIAADVSALREQEQLRRDMTANIAHDLITPLTAIQGYSEAIADDVISDPRQRHETAQLIGREVQRLRRLVSDMQNMTSLESGRLQLEIEPLNLHDLVTETLAVIAPECEQAQIKLHNAIDPATPLALADSDRLTQVLLNLLDNARRHTPAGGRITLGARAEHGKLTAWISDTGVGISHQDLPYIFERFYRVDRSRASHSGGTGLGLAIIKAIIVAHGGSVWAQSTPKQGTTIFFTLPLAARSEIIPPAYPTTPQPASM